MPNPHPPYRIFLCPTHSEWLVTAIAPHRHWKCPVPGCLFKRAAKCRTEYERRAFARHEELAARGEA